MSNSMVIKNVKLETGFATVKTNLEKVPEMDITKTGLFNIFIKDGVIAEIAESTELLKDPKDSVIRTYDAKGLLMMPSYVENHCHMDKTYYGEKWRAVTAPRNIVAIVESEVELYPTFKSSICERAKRLIDTFIKNGSTKIRTHIDIVKGGKIGHLEEVQKAFASYGDFVEGETIAFPQHGLLRSNSKEALAEALKKGANLLGGLDPHVIDEDREKSLNETMELAVKYNVPIDYHLHEGGEEGLKSFRYFVKLIEDAKWQDKVTISHSFFLSSLEGEEKKEIGEIMAKNGISLASQVPVNGNCPDFPYFDKLGVKTSLGIDCINDSWWPYGTGSVLEKLNTFGQVFAIRREKELADALKYITGYVTPLNQDGEMVWPKVNDKANFLLVEAECTAHVVGRRLPNKCVVRNGNIAYGVIE